MATEIIVITGGQRSGKSSFAQQLAREFSSEPVYLATARQWDQDFEKRIARHRSDRGDAWRTVEEDKHISRPDLTGHTVVLDCITLWLTNIYYDHEYNAEASLKWAMEEWDRFIERDFRLIVVTNEIGMGVHAQSETARHFTDLQGWMNQYIARKAPEVYLMVSGIPVKVK
ncbi:MAG TPA: bifunctional adenosylcobinamide kinase/adenosylcobinamide-phosphate guanylyltransferase [Bacteroidales bacterium]|nr:bifunctional adenosylcobinamide kinase/adenosylcobinamide-phosphate guanylyltransferase [Bacteroidales bacterium]